MSSLRRYLPLFTLAVAICALYLYRLNGVGVLGPDEPRYAAIGEAMARNGDLVTPRLWGSPWFEKPPLLYWMTAAGASARLGPELAARLPVALLSLIFLGISVWILRNEFCLHAAVISAALLATSAGWVAYSSLALTDLPLSVFFSLAVFLALPLVRPKPVMQHEKTRFFAIGACVGLAALAKGLVPLALAVPFAWFLRRFWRSWWIAALSFCLVALPWYVLVYLRNGYPFIHDFFLKHHFERLYSPTLQHVQPWYYYIPVLLMAAFPWTPLLGLLVRAVWDPRRAFLASIVCFGFVLFSASLNKLPGYLLPLLPSLFALLGSQFETRRFASLSKLWLLPCALLIAVVPLLAHELPESLSTGRFSAAAFGHVTRVVLFYVAVPVAVIVLARRQWVGALLVLSLVAAGLYLKANSFPVLDRRVSARCLWREYRTVWSQTCDAGTNRDWLYGVSFYNRALIPPCVNRQMKFALRSSGHEIPTLTPLH